MLLSTSLNHAVTGYVILCIKNATFCLKIRKIITIFMQLHFRILSTPRKLISINVLDYHKTLN